MRLYLSRLVSVFSLSGILAASHGLRSRLLSRFPGAITSQGRSLKHHSLEWPAALDLRGLRTMESFR